MNPAVISIKTRELSQSVRQDLALLRDHMLRCGRARGPLYRMRRVAESVDAFLAPRFVTTLGLTLLVLAGTSMVV